MPRARHCALRPAPSPRRPRVLAPSPPSCASDDGTDAQIVRRVARSGVPRARLALYIVVAIGATLTVYSAVYDVGAALRKVPRSPSTIVPAFANALVSTPARPAGVAMHLTVRARLQTPGQLPMPSGSRKLLQMRRHAGNDTLDSADKTSNRVEGEVCAGKAGRVDFVEANPLVATLKIDGSTSADGEQTSAFVSTNPSRECDFQLGDTTDGKTVAVATGDAPKKCWTCTDGETADNRKVRDCITKVVSKFYPFDRPDWALPCRDPDGKPLDESRTLAWYRLYTEVDAQTKDYMGSVSNTVTAGEGRLEDGAVKVIGGGQEGADYAATADVPSMVTKDGTTVGQLKNKSWSIQAMSTKTGEPVETLVLVEDDKVLRPDLVTVSADGMMLSGQAFRVRKEEPWHKFLFQADAVAIETDGQASMKRLLQAPVAARRDEPKPIAFEATFIVNSNNQDGGGNGGINQIAVAIGGSALVLGLVAFVFMWMWLKRDRRGPAGKIEMSIRPQISA